MTITEKLKTITAEELGLRVATVFAESKSSTVVFFIQQALKDCEDDNGIFWEAFKEMLDRLQSETRN